MTTKPDDLEAVRSLAATLEPFDVQERERILRWVRERLGMVPGHVAPANIPGPDMAAPPVSPSATPGRSMDIRTFVANKAPKTDLQLIPVVAYFHRFVAAGNERKEAISAEDIKDACRKAGRAIPKRTDQTLVNALSSGYMDRAGRGLYAINTVGENLVATVLGSSDGEPAAKARKKPAARRPAEKKAAVKKANRKKPAPKRSPGKPRR